MKHFKLLVSSVLLGLFVANIAFAQAVNMDKYITLKVQEGEYIALGIQIGDTPVKIISGDNVYDIGINDWHQRYYYLAGDTIMTIYGDVLKLDCENNSLKLIDVSHNTTLIGLHCPYNQLSQLDLSYNVDLEELNCSNNYLSNLDLTHNIALQELRCYDNKLVDLDLQLNVNLELLHCYDNRLTDLVLGQNTNLQHLACYKNKLTYLDVHQNAALTILHCDNNQLTDLNISGSPNIKYLSCYNNNLRHLDLSHNIAVTKIICSGNQLDSLDISYNSNLRDLVCFDNQLRSLKIGQNINLEGIECQNNQLEYLQVQECPKLAFLVCYGNLFNTAALDMLYCALPHKTGETQVGIYPLNHENDINYADVIASNAQNARDKNWIVCYFNDEIGIAQHIDIPTTGTYECTESITEAVYNPITIYPNPVIDILHIDTDVKKVKVQLHNLSGTLVLENANCQNISIAHLPEGVYLLTVTTAQGVYTQKVVKQ